MLEHYQNAVRRFAEFHGRSTRAEYWSFIIIVWLMAIGAILLDLWLMMTTGILFLVPFSVCCSIFHFIPSIAVTIRRFHDAGYSGWLIFVSFVPFVGGWILIIFMLFPSEGRENRWGLPWPHAAGAPSLAASVPDAWPEAGEHAVGRNTPSCNRGEVPAYPRGLPPPSMRPGYAARKAKS